MSTMNGISNKTLIVLVILIRCSLSTSAVENGTYDESNEYDYYTGNGMMYTSNDLQCLAQMPVGDLMKIRKAIRMMHAVSDYDAHQTLSHLAAASKTDNQSQNQSNSLLRELPVAETRTAFQYFTSTTKSPLAEPFMMTNQMHNAWRNNQLTHKTGYGSDWEEEKPSKIQKVLHLSITALTFLAFAGYLLCMIVQAIKSKGTTYYKTGSLMAVQTGESPKFAVHQTRFRRNTRSIKRITVAEPDPLSMFEALIAISKGYVQLSSLSQPPI